MPGPNFEREFLEGLRTIGAAAQKKPPTTQQDPTEAIETVDENPEVAPAGAPVLVSTVTMKNAFRHPDSHPIFLDLLLLAKYGPDWMGWETEVLEEKIHKDFNTQSINAVNWAKINAVKTLHMVDSFWQQWEVFVWCTMALNGVPPDFVTMQVPTVSQALVAVDIANRIRQDVHWSEEIKAFIGVIYRHEDIFCPQPPTEFVKLDTEGLLVDCEEVSSRWPEVRSSGKVPTGDTITDEQLRRLLIVTGFLEESRQHLQQQLPLVHHASVQ